MLIKLLKLKHVKWTPDRCHTAGVTSYMLHRIMVGGRVNLLLYVMCASESDAKRLASVWKRPDPISIRVVAMLY